MATACFAYDVLWFMERLMMPLQNMLLGIRLKNIYEQTRNAPQGMNTLFSIPDKTAAASRANRYLCSGPLKVV